MRRLSIDQLDKRSQFVQDNFPHLATTTHRYTTMSQNYKISPSRRSMSPTRSSGRECRFVQTPDDRRVATIYGNTPEQTEARAKALIEYLTTTEPAEVAAADFKAFLEEFPLGCMVQSKVLGAVGTLKSAVPVEGARIKWGEGVSAYDKVISFADVRAHCTHFANPVPKHNFKVGDVVSRTDHETDDGRRLLQRVVEVTADSFVGQALTHGSIGNNFPHAAEYVKDWEKVTVATTVEEAKLLFVVGAKCKFCCDSDHVVCTVAEVSPDSVRLGWEWMEMRDSAAYGWDTLVGKVTLV